MRRAAAANAAAQQAASETLVSSVSPGTLYDSPVSALAAALAAVVHITSGCEEAGTMDPGGERRADHLAVQCLA